MAVLTAVAPEREAFIAPVTRTGKVTIRKSVYALTPDDVRNYRLAVYRIAKISAENVHDNRGYQWIAGVHGQPGNYCHRTPTAFAIWHRPFVQQFEQRLQDAITDPNVNVFLPYWDWTTRKAQAEGIPQIFLDPTWTNPDTGHVEPNPLLSQPQTLINRGMTVRGKKANPANLVPLRDDVHTALLAPDYYTFSHDLENPHNSLHGFIGGSMGSVAYAAYDPLFWAHHCFVEYVFCQWQDAHPAAVEPNIDPRDLAPWSVTIDRIWDYKKLGYAYEPDNASELRLNGVRPGPGAAAGNTLRSRATVAHFPVYTIDPADFMRADLRFEGLRPPVESFAVRVFADQPDADAGTPTDENVHYLGTRYFFGHGDCGGAEGHCDPVPRDIYDLRPPHHYDPRQVRLNVTKRLKRLLALGRADGTGKKDAEITLVAVDPEGLEVEDADLYFEGLSIIVR